MPVTHHYIVIPAIGSIEQGSFIGGKQPRYHDIRGAIRNHFDEPFEHVTVLHDGERRDMFVGETSSINGRHIRNVRATAIYRNNILKNEPGINPESLHAISGPAVLFMSRVWF